MTDEHASPTEPRPSPSSALVPTDGGAVPDPFEREYMKGEGTVLYRDKMVAGTKMNLWFGGIAALAVFSGLSTGQWGAAILALPLLLVMWLVMGVLRVTVSEQSISVKLGLFGPTIPMAAVESAVAGDYPTSVNWGVLRMSDGKAYKIIGDEGRAVKIRWRDAQGRAQATYVFTKTADALARAIQRARRALPEAPEHEALPERGASERE